MTGNPVLERRERDRKRDKSIRAKHGVTMACTLAYGVLAAALFKPIFQPDAMSPLGFAGTLVGVAVLAVSYYLVPMGEHHEPR